jgi:hypothetical protein
MVAFPQDRDFEVKLPGVIEAEPPDTRTMGVIKLLATY